MRESFLWMGIGLLQLVVAIDCDDLKQISPWGHLYLRGGSESIEFFTATDSALLPCSEMEIIKAEPYDACADLDKKMNAEKRMLVIHAGGACTLEDKIKRAKQARAEAVIMVHSDNSLTPIPNYEANISVVLVKARSGMILDHYFSQFKSNELIGILVGEYMNISTGDLKICGGCRDVNGDAFSLTSKPKIMTGGLLNVVQDEGREMDSYEFFPAQTGSPIPLDLELNLLYATPENGCSDLYLSKVVEAPFGIILSRGDCTFSTKLAQALKAGASFVVFSNYASAPMVVPLVGPEYSNPAFKDTFNPASVIPSVMVRFSTGEKLREALKRAKVLKVKYHETSASIDDLMSTDYYSNMHSSSFWGEEKDDKLAEIRSQIQVQFGSKEDSTLRIIEKERIDEVEEAYGRFTSA